MTNSGHEISHQCFNKIFHEQRIYLYMYFLKIFTYICTFFYFYLYMYFFIIIIIYRCTLFFLCRILLVFILFFSVSQQIEFRFSHGTYLIFTYTQCSLFILNLSAIERFQLLNLCSPDWIDEKFEYVIETKKIVLHCYAISFLLYSRWWSVMKKQKYCSMTKF